MTRRSLKLYIAVSFWLHDILFVDGYDFIICIDDDAALVEDKSRLTAQCRHCAATALGTGLDESLSRSTVSFYPLSLSMIYSQFLL